MPNNPENIKCTTEKLSSAANYNGGFRPHETNQYPLIDRLRLQISEKNSLVILQLAYSGTAGSELQNSGNGRALECKIETV